jgi:hypothetical protein
MCRRANGTPACGRSWARPARLSAFLELRLSHHIDALEAHQPALPTRDKTMITP